jgi:carbon monoxide dehydrogenase subunit G
MKITKEFDVSRPADTVWDFFQDIPAVAQCLPGAQLNEDRGEGVFAGSIGVNLGPINSTFEGECTVDPNHGTRTASISGKGVDRRGGSRGQMKLEYRVEAAGPGTKVIVDADISLSGTVAQFGRTGLVEEMANRLIADFVDCLERRLEAETPEEAAAVSAGELKGLSLFFASLWAQIKRLFRWRD